MRAETLCANVLAATVNGVYQGIVLTIAVGVLLRLLARTNAATRHAVWFVCLVLISAIVPAHYWLGRPALNPGNRSATPLQPLAVSSAENRFEEPEAFSPAPFEPSLPGNPGELAVEIPLEPLPMVEAQPQPALDGGLTPAPFSLPTVGSDRQLLSDKSVGAPAIGLARNPVATVSQLHRPFGSAWAWARGHFLRPIFWTFGAGTTFPVASVFVVLWLIVAVVRLVVLAVRLLRLGRMTHGASKPPPELGSLFESLHASGNVKRKVELRLSMVHRSPLVLGFFRPVVLIPADLAAQPDLTEVRHVLAHELAHVRRYDDWLNLFQHFAQAVLFFHPSVWWITRKLSLEREIACDDHALRQSGGPRRYALVLANVANRISQKAPMLAPGVWNSHSQLQQRISMILNTRRNSSPALAKARLASIVTATAVIGVAALQIGPRVVFAESPPATPRTVVTAGPAPAPLAVVSLGEPGASAPAAISLVAQADAPGVEPGPKFKPDAPPAEPPEPPEAIAPDAPVAPGDDVAPPSAPHVARMSKPGKSPRAMGSDDAVNAGDGSLEDRVRRLEKMVQELATQQKIKRGRGDVYFKDGDGKEYGMARDEFMMKQQQLDALKASAERMASAAAEQAQRAAEQAKRATKDLQARLDQDQQGQGEFREGFQRQLEALRKARESLGREMERLDRQIEKLEKAQQHGEKDRDKDPQRRSEVPAQKLQAQAAPTPEVAE